MTDEFDFDELENSIPDYDGDKSFEKGDHAWHADRGLVTVMWANDDDGHCEIRPAFEDRNWDYNECVRINFNAGYDKMVAIPDEKWKTMARIMAKSQVIDRRLKNTDDDKIAL